MVLSSPHLQNMNEVKQGQGVILILNSQGLFSPTLAGRNLKQFKSQGNLTLNQILSQGQSGDGVQEEPIAHSGWCKHAPFSSDPWVLPLVPFFFPCSW